jgi:23S rRNA (guanosine2251-2'-O)-methyltransferase
MIEKKMRQEVFRIESISAIKDYLSHSPESIVKIVCKPSALKKAKALSSKVPIVLEKESYESTNKDFSKGRRRGSLYAEIKLNFLREDQLISSLKKENIIKPAIIVILDHLKDPVNVGGVIRNAAFFGVPYVVIPKNRQAPINDVVIAASQGGLLYTEVVEVVNLARVIQRLKKIGYWILGSALDGQKIDSVKNKFEHVALIVGAEDKGISPLVKSSCDLIVKIPQKNIQGHNSLNAAVASGVLLYALQ